MRGARLLPMLLPLAVLAAPGCAGGPDAAALYAAHCQSCHGADGRGDPRRVHQLPGLDLGRSEIVARRLENRVYRSIYVGGAAMPGFAHKLEHQEIGALARYVLARFAAAGAVPTTLPDAHHTEPGDPPGGSSR